MPSRILKIFFLFMLVLIPVTFSKMSLVSSSEININVITPSSQKIPPKEKVSTPTPKKERTTMWEKIQNMKKKMFVADQADSTHLTDPFVMKVPSLKLKDSPCAIQPSLASVWTTCKW